MRSTILALALIIIGCSTTPTTKIPAPSAARDGKTPIALARPSFRHRIVEKHQREAQVAQGKLAVDGQLVR